MQPSANIVAGQLSSPQKLVHNSTRTREQEAVGQRRQKGISQVLGMVGPRLCSLFPFGLDDLGREGVLHLLGPGTRVSKSRDQRGLSGQ